MRSSRSSCSQCSSQGRCRPSRRRDGPVRGPRAATEEPSDGDAGVDWTGTWRSFWRGGQALMKVEQGGEEVTGTYEPGEGEITGTVDGVRSSRGPGASRARTASSSSRSRPTGRASSAASATASTGTASGSTTRRAGRSPSASSAPRRVCVADVGGNAAAQGDSVANSRCAVPGLRGRRRGRTRPRASGSRAPVRLLDLSTFRVDEAPMEGVGRPRHLRDRAGGRRLDVPGRVRRDRAGPLARRRAAARATPTPGVAALEALGVEDLRRTRRRAQRHSPRQACGTSSPGTATWNDGGDELALCDPRPVGDSREAAGDRRADGSRVHPADHRPPRPVVRRRCPTTPTGGMPYVVYEHALGAIAVDRFAQEDGSVRWLFTADSAGGGAGASTRRCRTCRWPRA